MVAQTTRLFRDLPVLSLNAYREGGNTTKLEFLDGLQKSYDSRHGGPGFAKITDTWLDPAFTEILLRENRAFYEQLSVSEKLAYDLHCRGQRGYTGFGVEKWKGARIGDIKEMLMWGRDGTPGEPLNITPHQVPGLNPVCVDAYNRIENDNRILYRAISEILDIDPRYLDWDWGGRRLPNSALRTIFYPAITPEMIRELQEKSGTTEMPLRAAGHTDINRLTWLYLGDSSEGLELLYPAEGTEEIWDPATVDRTIAVVNVGDLLCTETDGIFPSAWHRVVVTNPERARYSFPCFTHPAKGKALLRLLNHPERPGEVYRKAFVEVYRQEVYDLLAPEVKENLGRGRLRICYDDFLERRLSDIGVFNDDRELEQRILSRFEGRTPRLADPEDWEMAA